MNNDYGKKLYRSRHDNILFGVCGGIADYFDWDSTLIRLATAILTILGAGSLVPIYLIAAIIIPMEPRS